MSTDTQPTKFCVDCKWYCKDGRFTDCNSPFTPNFPYLGNPDIAAYVYKYHCGGEWWNVTVRPSILQRIINKAKRWFK